MDQPSYVSTFSFARDQGLGGITVGMAWDGTNHWNGSGNSAANVNIAQYDGTGAFIANFVPGYDLRSTFTMVDGTGPLYARAFSSPDILVQSAPGVLAPSGVTLTGGTLDAQSGVVFDPVRGEYIAHINGSVSRWDGTGAFVDTLTLQGYGVGTELDYPQDSVIATVDGFYLTYDAGTLSAWEANTGTRVATTTLTAAGTLWESYWSLSYANGHAWILDSYTGDWQGFDICGGSPPVEVCDSGYDDDFDGDIDCDDTDCAADPACTVCTGLLDDPSYMPVSTFPRSQSFTFFSIGLAYDGTDLWDGAGGTSTGTTFTQYSPLGAVLAEYMAGFDLRSVFTMGDGTAPVYARPHSNATIYEMTSPGTLTSTGITLTGGTLDSQAAVVYDTVRGEYISHYAGQVSRWDAAGTFIDSLPLVGYGVGTENDYPQNSNVATVDGVYLTYDAGIVSSWDATTGARIASSTLTGAGSLWESYWSFSYADGQAWVLDSYTGNWQGYDIGCGAPTLVGSFAINDGPLWYTNPPAYTCLEACALLFGGNATDYQCSTSDVTVDNMAYVDGWDDTQYCTTPVAEDFGFDQGGGYDCGTTGCSYSAYVNDHSCASINYCWQ